jgi:antitoxin component YwqK of YwqJK toxin-antitoxin module
MREKIIYRDGVRNGGYTYWYLNGQKMREGSYKEGKKDGEWDQWY